MSDPKRPRRHFTAEEKAKPLRRHLADKVAISDFAEEPPQLMSSLDGSSRSGKIEIVSSSFPATAEPLDDVT